ncbi:MAG: Rab family GTPase [Candidatus Hodarchaeota archaeon]
MNYILSIKCLYKKNFPPLISLLNFTIMAEYSFKVIVIGPPAVGKSSLIRRFIENKFSMKYKFTIGVDFSTKDVKYKSDKIAKLTIWDIGGQDRFKTLRRNFYDGTQGALVVFDLSRAQTFPRMKDWISNLRQTIEKNVPIIIIGNKTDLISELGQVIDQNEVNQFAEKVGAFLIKTSAKTGENVEEAFVKLTQKIIKNISNSLLT